MKPGRNDPCPCGSGKKYKQCCLMAEQAPPENEFLWRRIRRAIEGSPMRMLEFATAHFGREALPEAWDDFMPHREDEQDGPFTMDTPHMPVFMPWFFYEWLPYNHDTAVKREAQDRITVGRAYLDKKGRQLDPLLARYIEQCCASPFSFCDILSVRPGAGFTARDIFTGKEMEVTEHSGSRQSRAGDILFGKLVVMDGVTMLEACAPFMFPPMEKGAVLELRKQMERRNKTITPEVLREYRYEMLDIYHDIVDRLLNPPMPQLQNTDGDPLLPHRLVYGIESPRAAFDALSPLCLTGTAEELLADAESDASGNLRKVEFSWQKKGNEKHQSWDSTVLGHIEIEGNGMTIEVNSENRAQKIRTLVEKMLPGACYKTTVIESLQSLLAREKEQGETAASRQRRKEQEELNSRPEIRAQIAGHLRRHFSTWPETSLPALGGKTPMQAVKTRDGREMVEALLLDFERRSSHTNMPFDPAIIAELREKLELP
ncbi:MAG: SEC-C domain-containing protein [Nitrosomonadales bacterium]|nr:SEC-C domain-containing protein [Nitrosomonadales bacterium]